MCGVPIHDDEQHKNEKSVDIVVPLDDEEQYKKSADKKSDLEIEIPEDQHAKCSPKDPQSYCKALCSYNLPLVALVWSIRKLGINKLAFLLYAFWTLASGIAFVWFQGIDDANQAWKFAGMQLEILGLVMLQEKIKDVKSVSGMSGMTFIMQAVVYFGRIAWSWHSNQTFIMILELVPLILALDIVNSIFRTRHITYDAELDILKVWYLMPACLIFALVVRPNWVDSTDLYNYAVGFIMYVDAIALMPQVVMMAKSGGRVQAPIANFVAATAIARCGDVFHTVFIIKVAADMNNWQCLRHYLDGDLDELGNSQVFSWVLCTLVHVIQLFLVMDFLYYFYKARVWARKVTEEVSMAPFAI